MHRRTFLASAALAAATPALAPALAAARTAKRTANTVVAKYAFSNELFEVNGDTSTYLTAARWRALGHPQPQVMSWIPGTRIFQFKGLSTLYLQLGPLVRPLTPDQWRAINYAPPTIVTPAVVKYPWQDDLFAVFFPSAARETWIWQHLTAPQWAALGRPAPREAAWIQGTQIRHAPDRDKRVYASLNGVHHELTLAQWQAMGSPQPQFMAYMHGQPTFGYGYTRMSVLMNDMPHVFDVTYGAFSSHGESLGVFVDSMFRCTVRRTLKGASVPQTITVKVNGGISRNRIYESSGDRALLSLPREGTREIIVCTYDGLTGAYSPHWQGRFPVVNGRVQVPPNFVNDVKLV